jgi:hypothetical protein
MERRCEFVTVEAADRTTSRTCHPDRLADRADQLGESVVVPEESEG